MKEWTMEATIMNISVIIEEINRELDYLNCSKAARRKINVALDDTA